MRIALDAMGGDRGPPPNVAGALRAVASSPDLTVVLVGDEAQLRHHIPDGHQRIEILHCADTIGMNEKPVEAFRKKPDNTIARCWTLLAQKKVDGLVSAGNTGAVVAGGLFLRKFLKGVRKPGIAAVMPTVKGRTVILDVGANVFPKPTHLHTYGVMGGAYAKHVLGIERPSIGLMNVGEEEGKGHDLVRETYELFRSGPLKDRFIGNVEGRDIYRGVCDVIVTDGFVGNVLLKQAEGQFEFTIQLVMKEIVETLSTEKSVAMQATQAMVDKFHHSSSGGALLLGIDGVCVICHGSSDERAMGNALGLAAKAARVGLNDRIVGELETIPPCNEDDES